MENQNKPNWNVNLNYITKDDLKTFYGFVPDADQTTTDKNKTDLTIMAISISSERVNTLTGNQIESIGIDNLNETQKTLVKRATSRMAIYYLTDGMSFLRASVSISGNGLSSSISPPIEPDYVLNEVYNLLQQANLHTPRVGISSNISCNNYNFNTPSIYDESDTRVISWDSGNKTFLQKLGLIAGTNIKLEDISDTIPKLKINSTSGIVPDFKSPKGTINIQYDKEKHLVNSDISDNLQNEINSKQNITDNNLHTKNKTIVGAINEFSLWGNLLEMGGIENSVIYSNQPTSFVDLSLVSKKYVDESIPKLDTRTYPDKDYNVLNLNENGLSLVINTENKGRVIGYLSYTENAKLGIKLIGIDSLNLAYFVVNENLFTDELKTISKTIIGAINELVKTSDSKIDTLQLKNYLLNQNLQELNNISIINTIKNNTTKFNDYWTKEETKNEINNLDFEIKSLIGKIAEDNRLIVNLQTQVQQLSSRLSSDEKKISQWKDVGSKVSDIYWNYNLIIGKKYLVKMNWEPPNITHDGYNEYIFVWAGKPMTIIELENVLALGAIPQGINIIQSTGMKNGKIIGLQESDI